jgi:hypothetical protein
MKKLKSKAIFGVLSNKKEMMEKMLILVALLED